MATDITQQRAQNERVSLEERPPRRAHPHPHAAVAATDHGRRAAPNGNATPRTSRIRKRSPGATARRARRHTGGATAGRRSGCAATLLDDRALAKIVRPPPPAASDARADIFAVSSGERGKVGNCTAQRQSIMRHDAILRKPPSRDGQDSVKISSWPWTGKHLRRRQIALRVGPLR
jgi:hypothetical protein